MWVGGPAGLEVMADNFRHNVIVCRYADDGRVDTPLATDNFTTSVQTLDNVNVDVLELADSQRHDKDSATAASWTSSTDDSDDVDETSLTASDEYKLQCLKNVPGGSEVLFNARNSSNVRSKMIVVGDDTKEQSISNHDDSRHDPIFIQNLWHKLPRTVQAHIRQKIASSTAEIGEGDSKVQRRATAEENFVDRKTEEAAENTDSFLLQVHCSFNIRCPKRCLHQSTVIEEDCQKPGNSLGKVNRSIPVVVQSNQNAAGREELFEQHDDETSAFSGAEIRTRSCAIGRRHLKNSRRSQKYPGMTSNDWNPPVTLTSKHRVDVSTVVETGRKKRTTSPDDGKCREWSDGCSVKCKRRTHDKPQHSYTCPHCTFQDADRAFVMHHARLAHAQTTFRF